MRPFHEVASDFCAYFLQVARWDQYDRRMCPLLSELIHGVHSLRWRHDYHLAQIGQPNRSRREVTGTWRQGPEYIELDCSYPSTEGKLVRRRLFEELWKIYETMAEGLERRKCISQIDAEQWWAGWGGGWATTAISIMRAFWDSLPELEFESTAETGILDIRCGPDYTELYVNSQPVCLTCSIAAGTTLDELIRIPSPDGEQRLHEFRETLKTSHHDLAIGETLAPFLAPGRYRITHRIDCCVDRILPAAPTSHFSEYYPGSSTSLIATCADEDLNPAMVETYRQQIQTGLRPQAIALSCLKGDPQQQYQPGDEPLSTAFVLDGHHKLRAYRDCQVLPHAVVVCRLNSPTPQLDYPIEFKDRRRPTM